MEKKPPRAAAAFFLKLANGFDPDMPASVSPHY